ncbi:hypothetical protein [Vibrio owensii]|uniref:hypothetical protein n=1 Tax=Vibrio harveyi group TaxID=717610 RepID=UPI003CC64F82
MITIIAGKIPDDAGIKINVDDLRIKKALEGGTPLIRSIQCQSITDVVESLRKIHLYGSVDMVIQTENEDLLRALSEKDKIEFLRCWSHEKNALVRARIK